MIVFTPPSVSFNHCRVCYNISPLNIYGKQYNEKHQYLNYIYIYKIMKLAKHYAQTHLKKKEIEISVFHVSA